MIQTIGKFNLLIANGIDKPQSYEMHRFEENKNILYHQIVHCLSILDQYCFKKEIECKDEKIKYDNYGKLNYWIWSLYISFFYIFDNALPHESLDEKLLLERLNVSALKEKYSVSQLVSSYHKYRSNYDQYKTTGHELLKDIQKSQQVFSELLSIFCVVRREQIHGEGIGVLISHPGYNFNKTQKDYLSPSPLVLPYAKFKVV